MFRRAFETQLRREGFTFVEVLTMCPTGWFVPTADGPDYMQRTLGEVHIMGELKADGRIRTTDALRAENIARQREVDDQLSRGGPHHDRPG
jgi:pyruvate/2-oxoacid:ferredoxin oxidoreductase beta subunit